jgi:excisionase family DNA binding protein
LKELPTGLWRLYSVFGLFGGKHERLFQMSRRPTKGYGGNEHHRQLKFFIGSADIPFTMNNAVSASTMFQPNGAPSTDNEILTVMDVAHFLRVPKSTVYKLARVGELPASKIGKHWRFLRRDIHEWMHSRSQQG